MRTRMLLAVATAAALTLTGCGQSPAPTTAAGAVLAGLGAEHIKVGVAFDTGGRGDKSFNDAAGAGLDRAKKELEVEVSEASPEKDADEDRIATLTELVEAGNNPVIAVGFQYAAALKQVASEHADTTFAIVDDDSIDADNVVSLVFAEEQGSYLVGAAAALKSRSNVIGYIGGVKFPLLEKFEAGFVAGAKRVNPKIEVKVRYLSAPPDFSGFGVPEKAEKVAAEMMADKADVIYAAAGGSGGGALKAVAATRGATFVGVDTDQYESAEADVKPAVLTSMLKRVDNAVFQEIQAFIKGDRAGGVRRFDLKTDGVGYAVSNEPAIKPLQAKLEPLRQQLYDGKIVAPTQP
ncbi:basic membrane protein A [Actinoplanes campanulatus]|uniref:Basic membrane protein A n=1 Tax=Actinoplanes campanulatus TaxID=113559 RepID=A0A7W5ADP8_9ACTN|nr:BMP family ABC transporter substrate-binding protein [Actinoplanes campanulatus]MBB3094140.1 basic membrane protein A [Actinoplanes campanulatus]GGN43451.1 BMP family ABC transporter substrate-binding protein [Actinoplanes campanulatus]GID42315.1 BMP family ABC transporter substrate-binding protein [Actinoplanes campanulatus]